MSTPLKTIFISEVIMVLAMIVGIFPQEFSYLILILLSIGFFKMSMLDALKLFIVSIPFFVALPPNAISDSMSVWRILIVVLFLRMIWEKCDNYGLLKKIIKQIQNNQRKKRGLKIVENVVKNKLFLYTIIFFIIAGISLFYAPSFEMGLKKILFLGNIILLFPIVQFSIKKEADFLKIVHYIFYVAIIIVSIGYLQFISTFFVPLHSFWQFWAENIIQVLYGQNLSDLLSFSNTWFSYYKNLPPTLRMFSVMPDSHSFAMFTVISIPSLFALIFYYKNSKKRFLYFVLVLFFMAISFSGSRGSWVGSIFALFSAMFLMSSKPLSFSYFQRYNPRKFSLSYFKEKLINNESYFLKIIKNLRRKNDSSNFIIISILLFLFLMPISFLVLNKNQHVQSYLNGQGALMEKSDIFQRAKSISDFSEISNKGRFQIWSETLTFVQKHPLTGVGFGNFPVVLGENFLNIKRGSSAHNIYLDILAELGVLGLLIFLLIIFEVLKKSYLLYFQVQKKYFKIFVGSFFVYFSWMFGYGMFDVVLLNDKVLIFAVIMTSLLYSIEKIKK